MLYIPFLGWGNKIPWIHSTYYYFAQDENLASLLKNFCFAQGINVVIDPSVEAKVSGFFEDVSPDDFLNQISKAYGLIWFYDGNILYINRFDSIATRVLQVVQLETKEIMQMMEDLNLVSSNFSLRTMDKDGSLVFLSGPPRAVDLVSELIYKLDLNVQYQMKKRVMRVFPLKYAFAYDISYAQQGGDLVVPGVATILNNLMGEGSTGPTGISMGSYSGGMPNGFGSKRITSASSSYSSSSSNNNLHNQAMQNATPPVASSKPFPGTSNDFEVDVNAESPAYGNFTPDEFLNIQADVRLNAVVVHDTQENIAMYEVLIKDLDVPVGIIAISAAIVEVDTQYTWDLGNKAFSFVKGSQSFGASFDGSTPLSPAGAFGADASGFNFSGQFTVDGATFLSLVKALETKGNAKVLSRPSVLTLDNVQAVLTRNDTFYVKVPGTYQSDLFNISSGVTLKVTPHIIDTGNGRQIKLLVDIEDGVVSSSTSLNVDNIPRTSKDTVTTQAVILENQSLLIGGYYRTEVNDGNSGLPIAKNLPVVGNLFKSTTKSSTTVERMFLITPTIIDLGVSNSRHDYDAYTSPSPLEKSTLRDPILTNGVESPNPEGYITVKEKPDASQNRFWKRPRLNRQKP